MAYHPRAYMLRIFARLHNYYFLLQVGRDTESAVLAIPEANPVFEAPVRFSIDGVTEKVTDGNLKYIIFCTSNAYGIHSKEVRVFFL